MSDLVPLTELEEKIIDFESQSWRLAGSKETAIRDEFGMRWMQYYQHLARILDKPAAERHAPELVRRLRSLRDQMIDRKYVRR